jgi:hypothetical protein
MYNVSPSEMASTGHSGTHAPQQMHSALIDIAICLTSFRTKLPYDPPYASFLLGSLPQWLSRDRSQLYPESQKRQP